MLKNIFFVSILLTLCFVACQKKVDMHKIKGTWNSPTAGMVTIGDSFMSYPNHAPCFYEVSNDTTIYVHFEMEDVIRVTEFTVEKLTDDSLVLNNDNITRYVRVK